MFKHLADQSAKNPVWRVVLWLFEIIVAIILLIDAIARPLYRPLLNWIATRQIIHRFEALIRPLPRFVILVLFGVPFVIAEPLKVFALVLVARGLVVIGVTLLILSYLVTFLIVERIYDAGREKLLTYWWFAWAMGQIIRVRAVLVAFKTQITARVRSWLQKTGPAE